MNKYFVTLDFGICGMTAYELVEAATLKEAEDLAYPMCIDHAETYGFYQDEEHFGDLDTVGRMDEEWDEDSDEDKYSEEGFISPSVESYDPEEHDGYL